MISHRSYIHNLRSCKNKAWKNSGLNGIQTHDLCDTGAVLCQLYSSWKKCFATFPTTSKFVQNLCRPQSIPPFLFLVWKCDETLALVFDVLPKVGSWFRLLHTKRLVTVISFTSPLISSPCHSKPGKCDQRFVANWEIEVPTAAQVPGWTSR